MSINKIKKYLLGKGLIILCLVMTVAILAYMAQSDKLSFVLGSKEKTHLRIGIVNQDEGDQLNNVSYNFGEDFTKLLAKDESGKTSWKVMSRDQAESQYKDNSLEAIIYIPKDFSHNVLQLSSFNPEKAKITYKVKESVKKEQSLEMAQQVGEYVNSLNQETIRLYFTSVVNNLDDAKILMNTIVGDESNIYNSLTTSILQPADQSIKSLDTIPSIAESVQSSNRSFEQSVLNFKTSTTDLLKANAESLLGQTDSISKYKAVQSQVANHNAQVAGNSSKNQYDKDNNLYQNLYNSTNDSLNIFGNTEIPTDPNIPPSYLVQLSQRIDNYNQRIAGFQTQVTQTQTELTALKTSLEGSRTQIAQNYFDGTIVDTSTLGDNESDITKAVSAGVDTNSVREALAKQVVSTLSSSDRLPGDYDNQVNSTIASISVNPADYASLFTKLKELGALTDAQIASYNSKLNLLTQYASVKGSTTGSMPGYTFITVANDVLPSTDSKTVTLDNVYPEVTTETSGTNKYNATPISVSNVHVEGAKSATVVPSTATISNPTSIQLQIQYTPDYGLNRISFDLQVGSEKIPMQYSFFYDKNKSSEALTQSDLSTVFEQLSRIDTAATTIKNIYGSPSSSYAVDVANPAGDSVAKMYGNVSAASVADKLQQKDVDQYRKSGIDLYVKLSMQINQLQAQIDSLPQLQGAELPNNYFTASIEDLTKWYQAASAKLKQEYEEWQKNGPELIEVSATNSGDGLATNKIYTTDESSDGLLDIVTRLASSTKNTSETINSNGSVIGSMETQFNSLSEQSKKVQEEVKQVHQQTETLIKNQSKNIEESTEFNKNFQGVLSNARSNGTDNQAVLNFLAKPIVTEKTNQSSVLSTTPIWAYLLVILLLTNIATGLMIREYSRQKREEAAEKEEEEHFE
jgi:conserved cell wall bound protein